MGKTCSLVLLAMKWVERAGEWLLTGQNTTNKIQVGNG